MTTSQVPPVARGPFEHTLERSAGLLYSLGPMHPPVLRVEPGARLRIETELNLGDVLHDERDEFDAAMVRAPFLNPATGPVYIEGAAPGDVVRCSIESIDVLSPGVTALVPGNTPFPDWIREREWGVTSRVVPISDGFVHWSNGHRLPVSPMVGVLGCAPLLDSVSTIDNGPHGGNLDVQEVCPGATVSLPVAVDGGLFALGDCHALQGDGELCGVGGIECRTWTTVTLDVAPRPAAMRWPRIEDERCIGVIACARPLEDAFRFAVRDLVEWMAEEYGFSVTDALMLLGQVAEARATQIVNPKYTYIVKIDRRWLT